VKENICLKAAGSDEVGYIGNLTVARVQKRRIETMGYRDRSNYNSGPREMHKVTCSDCGKETEVPFKPTEGRPVYCQECFAKHRPPRRF
jgi:CxxC-x17-CxxC domain-containing protein